MAQGNSGDQDVAGDAAGTEAQRLAARLRSIEVPASEALPPPPEVSYRRPDAAGEPVIGPSGHPTTYRVADDGKRVAGTGGGGSGSGQFADNAGAWGSGLGASVTFAASIVVGFGVGAYVDSKFGWAAGGVPWGLIVFGLAGIAAGFVNLFRLLGIQDRAERAKKNKP